MPEIVPLMAWKHAQAESIESVQLQMLKLWMYQALRVFSHSGSWWTIPISATSSGGSSIAAGIRKTIVVWYDWLRGVRTTNNCAVAAMTTRIANVAQPWVPAFRCESGGIAATAKAAATTTK